MVQSDVEGRYRDVKVTSESGVEHNYLSDGPRVSCHQDWPAGHEARGWHAEISEHRCKYHAKKEKNRGAPGG